MIPLPHRFAAPLAALVVAAAAANAQAQVVVLAEPAVPQYAQVLEGYRAISASAPVDVADAAAVRAALDKRPEVVVAVGSKAFELAKRQAAGATIVAAAVLSPDTEGRKDVTAVPLQARAADTLEALRSVNPKARRIVALHPPNSAWAVADAKAAAQKGGVALEVREVADLQGFQDLFRGLLAGHDAIWLLPDARLAKPELVKFMAGAALENRIALIGFLDGMTKAGMLFSVAADFPAIGKEAARLAQELAGRPAGERSNQGFRFAPGKLSVNERTRDALGLGK